MPALKAPPLPMAMVATGIPPGIWAVDRMASRPFKADESIGTPMTGTVVWAATTPARCAACPAPQIKIFSPRFSAETAYKVVRRGERWAEATTIS